MSSKISTILAILLILLLALLSWHQGIILINLNALAGVIWPILRSTVSLLMAVLLGHVLSCANNRTRGT